jgi:hypothetical protein
LPCLEQKILRQLVLVPVLRQLVPVLSQLVSVFTDP